MNRHIVAGIDGGQTSTTAAVALADGTIIGRGTGPPADLVGEPRGSRGRQREALRAALAAAFRDAGLPAATPLAALVVGLTGHDEGAPAPFVLSDATVEVFVHDTVIAHAGALDSEPGIVVLAGTGSVALGNATPSGPYVRAGGWGYFFGDAGSALWIAREAVTHAMIATDRGAPSPLGRAALAFFDVPDLRTLQHAFAHGELTRPALAAFAATALELADAGSPNGDAFQVRQAAAEALADLVAILDGRLATLRPLASGASVTVDAPLRVSYAGGVFASQGLRRTFAAQLRTRVPHAILEPPAGDPLMGAISLAKNIARTGAPALEDRK